jgi:hypothetical protein
MPAVPADIAFHRGTDARLLGLWWTKKSE